jgi:hypothetical protein
MDGRMDGVSASLYNNNIGDNNIISIVSKRNIEIFEKKLMRL